MGLLHRAENEMLELDKAKINGFLPSGKTIKPVRMNQLLAFILLCCLKPLKNAHILHYSFQFSLLFISHLKIGNIVKIDL